MVAISVLIEGWFGLTRWSPFSTMPLDELLDQMHTIWAAIAGTPEEVIEQIRAYEAAGVDEFMVQWLAMDDSDGLKLLAEQVLPYVASS